MNELSTILNHVSATTALLALGGGGVVAIVSQLLKKFIGLESEKVVQFMVVLLGTFAATLQYLLANKSNLPASVIGVHTATILGVAQPFYMYFVKPADSFLSQVKAYQASQGANDQPSADTQFAAVDPPAELSQPEQSQPPISTDPEPTSQSADF